LSPQHRDKRANGCSAFGQYHQSNFRPVFSHFFDTIPLLFNTFKEDCPKLPPHILGDGAMSEAKTPNFRPARKDEIEWVLNTVHRAIDESEFYCDEFKQHERERMNIHFLTALWEYDPQHLFVLRKGDEKVGIMISGPDNGVVFLYWSYIIPEHRASTIAIKGNKAFLQMFDNGHWHKLVTFTRTTNEKANLILARYGWTEVAQLNKHIFGEDYKIFEILMEKTVPGYKPFRVPGRLERLKRKLLGPFGKAA